MDDGWVDSKEYEVCYTGRILNGCSKYYQNSVPTTTISTDLMCAECIDSINWDLIKTSSSAVTIHGTTNSRTGLCVSKGKFIIYNPTCNYYTNT